MHQLGYIHSLSTWLKGVNHTWNASQEHKKTTSKRKFWVILQLKRETPNCTTTVKISVEISVVGAREAAWR